MAKKKESKNIEELLQEALIPKEEQPYEIPSNWEWVRTNRISDVITGNTPSKSILSYWDSNDIAFVGPADLDQKRNLITSENFVSSLAKEKIRLIPKESTLICCIGSIGKTAFNDIDCCTNQQINSLVPKKNINNLYIYYVATSNFYNEMLWNNSSATTISIINKGKMEVLPFPLPPLSEQTRIVNKLESMLSKLKEAKEKIAEAKESFELRRASILHKAFTGELTKQWREEKAVNSEELTVNSLLEKINEEKIKAWKDECKKAESEGKKKPSKPKLKTVEEMKISDDEKPYDLPQGWEWVMLGDVSEIIMGQSPDGNSVSEESNGIGLIGGPSDMGNKIPFIKRYTNQPTKLSKENDIIISIRATLGRPIYSDGVYCLGRGVAAFRGNIILKNLLYYYFEKETQYFYEIGTGTTFKQLSSKDLFALKIPFILPLEQQEIVARIETLLKAEDEAKDLINMEEQIDLLEKSILSKAFRGELGTNDPSDEPALELLKRVLGE